MVNRIKVYGIAAMLSLAGGLVLFFSLYRSDEEPVVESQPETPVVEKGVAENERQRENLDWLDEAIKEDSESVGSDPGLSNVRPEDSPSLSQKPAEPPNREMPRPTGPDGQPYKSRSFEVLQAVEAEQARLGPQFMGEARKWLESDDDLTRAAGAIGLAQAGALSEEEIRQIAGDSELSVPFLTLEAMQAQGPSENAINLENQLVNLAPTASDLILAQSESQAFSFGGGEAVIDFARENMRPEDVDSIADAFSADETLPYEARMKAAWEKRKSMPLNDYRDYLDDLKSEIDSAEASEWNEGIDRLQERWKGPVSYHESEILMDKYVVDQSLSRDFDRMLTDFRMELDFVLTNEDGKIGKGTADALTEYVASFEERPWTQAENNSLQRIAQKIEEIRVREVEVDRLISPPPQ